MQVTHLDFLQRNQNCRMKSATNVQIKHEAAMLWPLSLLLALLC